ncbi:hypothetical protein B0H14DRAFT_3430261 [Mycena olivaceomarginata]|nr:hypothetical protein B0H14DRAFT_3430261 [Mycena olivaceomarginata]
MQIDNTVRAAISDAPAPASTAALVSATPAPASTAAPAAVSNTAPVPISTATPAPDPPPVFRSAYAFVDDYGALQRNQYSGMNDYIGWDMGMPMGMGMGRTAAGWMGSGGMDEGMGSAAYAPSPMWPVLNMPP